MIIFISIVLIVHLSVNFFIYKHSKALFDISGWSGTVLKAIFIFMVFSYPLGRILEQLYPSGIAEVIAKIGSFWLGAMLYLFILFLLFDLAKLLYMWTGFPALLSAKNSPLFLRKIAVITYTLSAIIIISGYFNALYPKVNKVSIKTNKVINGNRLLRIGAASDIHLGSIITNGRLERFVTMMNSQNPDIILLAGDIFDEDLGPVIKNDMGRLLSKLNAPLGVYAVTGNHEYIGGVEAAVKYLEDHGVSVIRDSTIVVNSAINIVGREDRQLKMMGNLERKHLDSLTASINKELFTILLDHQPYSLNEAVQNDVDLQISGHTHHGQMFPLNLITRAMFEVSRGYKQIENTHVFVSTGFGTWGPPIRVGNRPEIVVFEVEGI
ncbi:MAG: metallophosphoesterase [Bacteroidales bacterium]